MNHLDQFIVEKLGSQIKAASEEQEADDAPIPSRAQLCSAAGRH